jgi:hypothetical protein
MECGKVFVLFFIERTTFCMLCICIVLSEALFGQNSMEPIRVETGRRIEFWQGSARLNLRDLVSAVRNNERAYALMTSAKGHYDLANFCRISGTVLIAIPVFSYLRDADPLWALAGGGAALWLFSFPLYATYEKRASEAAYLYNRSFAKASAMGSSRLEISSATVFAGGSSGFGLKVRIVW